MYTTVDSILLDILRSGGEERFQTEPKQEEALEKIVFGRPRLFNSSTDRIL